MSLSRLGALKAARARIANPDNWCQGILGTPKGAVCAAGALIYTDCNKGHALWSELNQRMIEIGEGSLSGFNDTHNHREVLALFDRFIAEEEMSLPGKSKTVTVEPLKTAPPAPKETPMPKPVEVPEKVPA